MKPVSDKIHQFFLKLGLSKEELDIYLILVQRGVLTILEISRATGISRTQVYRLLEKMQKRGLIEEVIDEHRMMAKAVGIEQLERLVREKERQVSSLRQYLPQIQQLLMAKVGQSQPKTRVLFIAVKEVCNKWSGILFGQNMSVLVILIGRLRKWLVVSL